MMGEMTTNDLMVLMRGDGDALDVLQCGALFSAPSFIQYLQQQMAAHHMSTSQLLVKVDISKTYIYQLLRGERRAGRDVVLRIALALKLTVDETQRLLTLSDNKVLYPRLRRDAAIIYAISKNMSLTETEELLASLAERSLFL